MAESTGSAGTPPPPRTPPPPPPSPQPRVQRCAHSSSVRAASCLRLPQRPPLAPIVPILQTRTKQLFKVIVKGKSKIPCSEVPEAEPELPLLDFDPEAHGQVWGSVGFSPSRDSQAQFFWFAENISASLPRYRVMPRMQPEPWGAGLS